MCAEPNRRLDSWKAIAQYLGRDVRTVMRWERQSGMPVHRVPASGRGNSVFGYTDEIDQWLSADGETARREAGRRSRTATLVVLAAAVGLALAAVWMLGSVSGTRDRLPPVVEISPVDDVIVARDADHQVVWSYRHPNGYVFTKNSHLMRLIDLQGDADKELLVAINVADPAHSSFLQGELYCFSLAGDVLWKRVIDDAFEFGAGSFGGPWVSRSVEVVRIGGTLSVAWSVNHFTWWPSVLELFDGHGDKRGAFVNAGWILGSRVLSRPDGDLVLAGGISNAKAGAMLAVLDGLAISGGSPEDAGSPYECRDCPAGRPLRYFVFPRTEVNRASGLPYNQVGRIEVGAEQVRVGVLEEGLNSDVQWIYDFTPDFELIGVTPGDTYWPRHRLLRLEGRIDHLEDDCPERVAPPILSWTPDGGWETVSQVRR